MELGQSSATEPTSVSRKLISISVPPDKQVAIAFSVGNIENNSVSARNLSFHGK
jgi:hypothetical protein